MSKSSHQFKNGKKAGFVLTLSPLKYRKIAEGNTLCFYSPSILSWLSIRTYTPTQVSNSKGASMDYRDSDSFEASHGGSNSSDSLSCSGRSAVDFGANCSSSCCRKQTAKVSSYDDGMKVLEPKTAPIDHRRIRECVANISKKKRPNPEQLETEDFISFKKNLKLATVKLSLLSSDDTNPLQSILSMNRKAEEGGSDISLLTPLKKRNICYTSLNQAHRVPFKRACFGVCDNFFRAHKPRKKHLKSVVSNIVQVSNGVGPIQTGGDKRKSPDSATKGSKIGKKIKTSSQHSSSCTPFKNLSVTTKKRKLDVSFASVLNNEQPTDVIQKGVHSYLAHTSTSIKWKNFQCECQANTKRTFSALPELKPQTPRIGKRKFESHTLTAGDEQGAKKSRFCRLNSDNSVPFKNLSFNKLKRKLGEAFVSAFVGDESISNDARGLRSHLPALDTIGKTWIVVECEYLSSTKRCKLSPPAVVVAQVSGYTTHSDLDSDSQGKMAPLYEPSKSP